MTPTPEPLATVAPVLGRYCLIVDRVVVAQEDDLCHDLTIGMRYWTKQGLERAAALINGGRWAAAADRQTRGHE